MTERFTVVAADAEQLRDLRSCLSVLDTHLQRRSTPIRGEKYSPIAALTNIQWIDPDIN